MLSKGRGARALNLASYNAACRDVEQGLCFACAFRSTYFSTGQAYFKYFLYIPD